MIMYIHLIILIEVLFITKYYEIKLSIMKNKDYIWSCTINYIKQHPSEFKYELGIDRAIHTLATKQMIQYIPNIKPIFRTIYMYNIIHILEAIAIKHKHELLKIIIDNKYITDKPL